MAASIPDELQVAVNDLNKMVAIKEEAIKNRASAEGSAAKKVDCLSTLVVLISSFMRSSNWYTINRHKRM